MAKKLLIDATHAEETRVVVLDGTKVEDFDFETIHKRQLAGNIYLAKVTRVEPSLQAAFVDYGGNRHGFLAFAEIHPDYYQIPVADRKALLEEERALARDQDEDEPRRGNGNGNGNGGNGGGGGRRRRPGPRPAAEGAGEGEAAAAQAEEAGLRPARVASGMDIVDLDEDEGAGSGAPSGAAADAAGASDGASDGDGDGGREASDGAGEGGGDESEPYSAADHASELDDQIESVADEDVSDEVRPRRPRARRYKIQEVIKVRQIMLVQVVKEERGNKGAALTTYLSLAGRYCVLMPNTGRGGGISRKITNAADRKKLKEIAAEMEVPEGAGLIIRTAGAQRTKPEIKRDYEYLFRLWEQIRDLTLKSIAPAPIYEEGDLIKRSIRDLYNTGIDEVLVEGEAGFRAARDFMGMIMPSHARNVKRYSEPMPLFARYQVESYLAAMFNPTVQLKSGGYIVIGVTEALVAIDINSGKATRQGSIEETALQTNLEAADEIARQLRLRDLAGLIVIDFIDMEERRNNAAVEKRLKDALRNDRARIQVGRISGFGLLEMSRQRLRPGMLEATTQPCPHCHGTGLIRSDNSIALAILRALEEEGVRKRSKEVLLRAPVGVINYLFNHKREHLAQIEARYGMAIRLEADPALISPDYSLEKFKTATRMVRAAMPVVSLDAQTMSGVDEDLGELDEVEAIEVEVEVEVEAVAVVAAAAEAPEQPAADAREAARDAAQGDRGEGGRRRRRRRRRRRTGEEGGADALSASGDQADDQDYDDDEGDAPEGVSGAEAPAEVEADAAPATKAEAAAEVVTDAPPAKPARARRSRSKAAVAERAAEAKAAGADAGAGPAADAVAEPVTDPAADPVAEKPARPRRTRRKPGEAAAAAAAKAEPAAVAAPVAAPVTDEPVAPEPVAPKAAEPAVAEPPTAEPEAVEPAAAEPEAAAPEAVAADDPAPVADTAAEPADAEAAETAPAPAPAAPEAPARPRRVGWWARKTE